MTPLASCLMPTFNRRPFVARAITLFQRQTYPNSELVILDDGDDAIGDLVPDDPAIRYIRAPRFASLGAKRNAACEAAKGDILLHWDDDDWYSPHRVAIQVEALRASGADLCGIDRVWFLDPAAAAGWEYVYPSSGPPWVCGATLCFQREYWRAHPFTSLNIGEDTIFAAAADPARLHVLPDKDIFVGLVHPANTCPRPTQAPLWRPAPLQEIKSAMGADWPIYIADEADAAAGDGVSVVIPHGGAERLPHLSACLAHLAQARGVAEIFIIELGEKPVAQNIARRWGAQHIFVRDEGLFDRARALNIGAALATSECILWLDNDLLVPPDFVAAAARELRRRDLDFLIPYSIIHYLSESDSQNVSEGSADPGLCRPILSLTPGRMISGGAGLVRRAFLRRHGGVPEGFRGWGGEDNAWAHKASLLGRSAISADAAQKLWHVFHPTSGAHDAQVHHKNPHYAENLRLLQNLCAINDKQIYLAKFPPAPPSCAWDRGKIIAFVAEGAREAADLAAAGMKDLLGLDISVIEADDRLGARLEMAPPDAIVLFAADNSALARGQAESFAKSCILLAQEQAPKDAQALAAQIAQPLSHLLNGAAVDTDDLAIWTYWEGECPAWIQACRASLDAHAPRHRALDRAAFEKLRENDRDIDIDRLQIAHRADFIRAYLLAHFGGLWIDSDCIAMKSLAPLLDLLRDEDFLAHRDRQNYFPNGFIGARRGSRIAQDFYQRLCAILRSGAPLGWISLGGEPLTQLLAGGQMPFREIPCEWIQPICWSQPEAFFARADAAAHEQAVNPDAFCYMLSNTEIRKYQAEHPELVLTAPDTFFSFLLDRSARGGETPAKDAQDTMPQVQNIDPATSAVFESLYRSNLALGGESVSGPGSSLGQTEHLRRSLPLLLQSLGVRSLIDAPCGDFNWLRHVELGIDSYLGVDIVAAIVERNQRSFAHGQKRRFIHADITRQVLPRADLILCRDCLVHLAFEEILQALRHFRHSGATYLLTTNFGSHRTNATIATGDWRPLNFETQPFGFPPPLRRLVEGCTEMGSIYADKSLSLWRFADLARHIG